MSRIVSPLSEIRVEVRMSGAYPLLSKMEQTRNEIDIQSVFNVYWNTNEHVFTVSSQSWPSNGPLISDREIADVIAIGRHNGSLDLQFSTLTVRLFCNCPYQANNSAPIGGIFALVAW
jgi:hypothetical protein